jgi:hypothetical protein
MNRLTVYKKIFFLLATTLFSVGTMACEICGCSISGYHFGILPQFRKNFIGLKYNYRSFNSQHLISEELYILGEKSTEHYQSAEVWGRIYGGKKLQLIFILPFNHFVQKEEGVKRVSTGLGDITLEANYTVYDDAANIHKKFKQTLLAGAGLKLPTGKFKSATNGDELNPSMNAGSGSTDFLLNGIYTCRYEKFGLNADLNYRMNTRNKDEFKFGNRLTSAIKFFYWKDLDKKITLLPNAGFLYERADADQHYDEKIRYSGGDITYLTLGTEAYFGKLNLGATLNHPLSQQLSKGLVHNNNQFSINATYMFK